jgi:hypothetical protein
MEHLMMWQVVAHYMCFMWVQDCNLQWCGRLVATDVESQKNFMLCDAVNRYTYNILGPTLNHLFGVPRWEWARSRQHSCLNHILLASCTTYLYMYVDKLSMVLTYSIATSTMKPSQFVFAMTWVCQVSWKELTYVI